MSVLDYNIRVRVINQLPPISRMRLRAPPPPPPDPLMLEIAALAEKRRAEAAVHVRQA